MSSPDRVAVEVEQMLVEAAADDGLSDDACARLLQMWRDATDHLDVSRAKKAGTWAAGVFYAFDRIRFGGLTQKEAADRFGVSVPSVGAKFQAIAEALDLLLYDSRYTTADERPAVFDQVDEMMAHLGNGPVDLGSLPPQALESLFGGIFSTGPVPGSDADRSQDLVYEAWERMNAGDPVGARGRFEKALALDPGQADALNGLSSLDDDAVAAEAFARRAVEAARARLGSDDPDAYMWWGELETRPYMRARCGLGLALSDQGRHREAAAEYEALLALNPGDNQGVRYLIGPEYLEAGDIEAAVAAYDAYDTAYPGESGEPDHAALHGLALWVGGRREDAVRAWVDALAANLYVIPAVAGATAPPTDLWFGSNYAWPDTADRHLDLYEELWDRWPDAVDALGRLWEDPEVQARVARDVQIGQSLYRLSEARKAGAEHDDARWRALVGERWAPRPALSADAVRRIVEG